MKVIAKVDFISLDFGNVKQGQTLKVKDKQAEQFVKLGLVEVMQETAKKGRK